MISATVASASNPDVSVSSDFSPGFASTSKASPLSLAKTAGVLALALTGGGRLTHAREFEGNRRLLTDAISYSPAKPFDYDSVCENGVAAPYVQGTNFEDCTAAENEKIGALKARKQGRQDMLKQCYSASGYLAAALFGAGFVAYIVSDGAPASNDWVKTSSALSSTGLLSLLPTTVCGIMYSHTDSRIEQSELKSEECCKIFPTKEELAVLTAEAPMPANTSSTGSWPR